MTPSTPPSISNPLRVLVLTTSPSAPVPQLLEVIARIGSDLRLQTLYYTTTLQLWHDSIPQPEEWEQEWLAPEAAEVIQSIGAWVVVFQKLQPPRGKEGEETIDTIRTALSTIQRVLSHHRETSPNYALVDNEPLLLLVGMPQPLRPQLPVTDDEWEGICLDCGGWEWIDAEAKGKNEFGENVGLERLKEVLEANEWDGGDIDGAQNLDDFETELGLRDTTPATEGIGVETDDPEVHEAILSHGADDGDEDAGNDDQIEELESLVLKMQAIKEKGASMSEEERKRFAAKAVMSVIKSVDSVN
ncbi:MAG: hypothetical protein Q9219_001441 [cf. Caloplaca sp. 3 TL-2023]